MYALDIDNTYGIKVETLQWITGTCIIILLLFVEWYTIFIKYIACLKKMTEIHILVYFTIVVVLDALEVQRGGTHCRILSYCNLMIISTDAIAL